MKQMDAVLAEMRKIGLNDDANSIVKIIKGNQCFAESNLNKIQDLLIPRGGTGYVIYHAEEVDKEDYDNTKKLVERSKKEVEKMKKELNTMYVGKDKEDTKKVINSLEKYIKNWEEKIEPWMLSILESKKVTSSVGDNRHMVFIEGKKYCKPDRYNCGKYMQEFNESFGKPTLSLIKNEDWDDFVKFMSEKHPNILLTLESTVKSSSKDPTKEEMVKFLNDKYKGHIDYTDEEIQFPIEAAIYWYAYNYHSGQNSNLYSALSTSKYQPSRMLKNIDDIDDDVTQEMYSYLQTHYGD